MSRWLYGQILTLVWWRVAVMGDMDMPTLYDMSLWIDETQVKEFSGYPMEIYAIVDGTVLSYILDPNFEKYLPVIPSEINSFNFTWTSGENKQYYYAFEHLLSYNKEILNNPTISIETKGKVPKKPGVFQVFLPCNGNNSGTARFSIGLKIQNEHGVYLRGTPLHLHLQKQCAQHDPECDKKCANGGRCNQQKVCECQNGFVGQHCRTALCYPQCMNGGTCVSTGVCKCADGYQGPHCEGGICRKKCLNRGKCVQKDKCKCRKGYYGRRCEYSKCTIPCLNGGKCIGVNQCRCKRGYSGAQCDLESKEKGIRKRKPCVPRRCKQRFCVGNDCRCEKGWHGRKCNRSMYFTMVKFGHPRQRRMKQMYV
ncbi:wnt inhibitory factor 1-like isoform X3 [Tachypleus tridentatus]|uniref:wnt inhibitory factor 1-like isoform X3 n=1 Tax=Tachypleus tridentatus TaxID=6853 RepID=UPI003FD637AB